MKTKIILIFITILSSSAASAQSGRVVDQAAIEKIEKEKLAFFTSYLELSSREAREFWPLYFDFQSRRNDFLNQKQSLIQSFSLNYGKMQEKEAKETADRYIDIQIKEIELAVDFHEKLTEILSLDKIMQLYNAENEFRRNLLMQLKGSSPGNHVP